MNKNEYAHTVTKKVTDMFLSVLKGYIIAVILIFILALIVTYTPFSNVDIPIKIISYLAIITASFFNAKKYRTLGWLNGAVSGVLYNLILYIISMIFFKDATVQNGILYSILTGIIFGIIGGIIGVNTRRK